MLSYYFSWILRGSDAFFTSYSLQWQKQHIVITGQFVKLSFCLLDTIYISFQSRENILLCICNIYRRITRRRGPLLQCTQRFGFDTLLLSVLQSFSMATHMTSQARSTPSIPSSCPSLLILPRARRLEAKIQHNI